MSQRRDYSQPPTGKQSLGEARPTRRKELHAGEAELLPQLIAKLKADPEGLWPLPPKMVIAGDVDATLVRFLRARKGKVPDAAQMLKDTVLWRRTDNVDQALETCPGAVPMAAIRSGISSAYVCNDYEGVPVYVERSGMLDMNAVLAKGTTVDELVRLHVVSMEYFTQTLCLEASIAQGQTIDKVVSVIDLTGVTMSNASNKHFIALFKQMSKIDSDNYPEVMKSVYIINAPWIFSAIFNLIKGFLDPSTQKKIKVVKPKDLSVLMAPSLDMSQIPQCVGGQGANTVLSQPDGSISEAHYKQDYHIESYRMALLDGDPLVGPNCFSYTDDWGEPLYKLCHRSDVGATVDGLAPTPSSPRSSFVEEELVEGMDAEVEEALTVLERAMARVMKLQQQSKTLSAKAGMGISVVPLARHSPRYQLPSDAPKELAEPKLANGHGGPSDSVPRGGCFGCFGGGPR